MGKEQAVGSKAGRGAGREEYSRQQNKQWVEEQGEEQAGVCRAGRGCKSGRVGHPFFSKERNILTFFYVLYKRTRVLCVLLCSL